MIKEQQYETNHFLDTHPGSGLGSVDRDDDPSFSPSIEASAAAADPSEEAIRLLESAQSTMGPARAATLPAPPCDRSRHWKAPTAIRITKSIPGTFVLVIVRSCLAARSITCTTTCRSAAKRSCRMALLMTCATACITSRIFTEDKPCIWWSQFNRAGQMACTPKVDSNLPLRTVHGQEE